MSTSVSQRVQVDSTQKPAGILLNRLTTMEDTCFQDVRARPTKSIELCFRRNSNETPAVRPHPPPQPSPSVNKEAKKTKVTLVNQHASKRHVDYFPRGVYQAEITPDTPPSKTNWTLTAAFILYANNEFNILLEANGGYLHFVSERCKTKSANTTKHFITQQVRLTRCFHVCWGHRKRLNSSSTHISEKLPPSPPPHPPVRASPARPVQTHPTLCSGFFAMKTSHMPAAVSVGDPLHPVQETGSSPGKADGRPQ